MTSDSTQITKILKQWQDGKEQALVTLMPMVYEHLRRIASRQFASESSANTLQPTALVNEAFLQLDSSELDFNDRRHFYAVAALTMRRILIDHARARRREKRGGDRVKVTLSDADASTPAPTADLLDLDRAIVELEQHNRRAARALELNYFAGLTREEAAEYLDVSPRTLDRDLRLGRAWLKTRLA